MIFHRTSHFPALPVVLAFGGYFFSGPQTALSFSTSAAVPFQFYKESKSPLAARLHATLAPEDTINVASDPKDRFLATMETVVDDANEYADTFGLTHTEAAIYASFAALRKAETRLGLKGEPFVLRRDEIMAALKSDASKPPFDDFFTMTDLAKAVEDDFLDAARGSTDNRKGWQVGKTLC